MGFMDWLMKGAGFENQEVYDDSVEKQKKFEERKAREEEKRRQKEERRKLKTQEKANRVSNKYHLNQDVKNTTQNDVPPSNTYQENPDQYNTSRTYDAPVNNYGMNSTNVGGYGTKSVEFAYPTRFDEAGNIINFLKEGESVMLNLTNMNGPDSQRLLDCVSGAVYALNGNIRRVDNNIFLLTPEGFNIRVPER